MGPWILPWIILWSVSWFGKDTKILSLANDIVSVNLSVANSCVAPDGFPRVAVLAGRQGEELTLPGPIISGYKGDRFLINVTNELTDTTMFTGTTIHWHGITQHRSIQMDGAAYVTQCPILPNASFLYNFTAGDQVGTFWYHSHYAVQYCDGLRGALIIREHPDSDEDPFKGWYDVDNDSTIITLMDWYHYPSVDLPRQIWPDSILINGTGCYDGLECPPPAIYMVEENKRYRSRLLNMACKTYYTFAIDDHPITVIEVDGKYVEPYTVDSIQIYAAQRYSFIVNATQPIDNYWIRAVPDDPMNATTTAILRYTSAPNVDPQTVNSTVNYLNETLLRSLEELPARLLQSEPDVRYNVVLGKSDSNFNFLINGVQYMSPSVPVLLQIMKGLPSWEVEPRESVFLLQRDQVVELVFHLDNTPGRPHPFHLHGHHFAVIKSADSQFRNFDKPVMRDTVSTGIAGSSDYVTIRFITNNPGPWILHCHIEWHFYAGMGIVFVEDYENIRNRTYSSANATCPYDNPNETFTLPPPRSTAEPYTPTMTSSTCTPTPFLKRGV